MIDPYLQSKTINSKFSPSKSTPILHRISQATACRWGWVVANFAMTYLPLNRPTAVPSKPPAPLRWDWLYGAFGSHLRKLRRWFRYESFGDRTTRVIRTIFRCSSNENQQFIYCWVWDYPLSCCVLHDLASESLARICNAWIREAEAILTQTRTHLL